MNNIKKRLEEICDMLTTEHEMIAHDKFMNSTRTIDDSAAKAKSYREGFNAALRALESLENATCGFCKEPCGNKHCVTNKND